MISNAELRPRRFYLNRLAAFQDTEPVKIITGIRRCGKSKLMDLMIQHIRGQGIPEEQILKMNFESYAFADMTQSNFHEYVAERVKPGRRMYLFFDEPQLIRGWEKVINAFRVDLNCDIYITGSNAYLLSGEYATYLSGRHVEIRMYPLTFSEFLDFHGFSVNRFPNTFGGAKTVISDHTGLTYSLEEVFEVFLRYGGMPGLADVGLNQENAITLLDGIYTTVLVRDILQRDQIANQRKITDHQLLQRISRYLAGNIGNFSSYTNMSKELFKAELLPEDGDTQENLRSSLPSVHTVQDYVAALMKAYMFQEVRRFDVKGNEQLKTLGKFYIADIGLRNYLLGFSNADRGKLLENVVYLELMKRGYDVSVGKLRDREVDFRAVRAGEIIYFQVTETLSDEKTRKRELLPLQEIADNYPKIILSMDPEAPNTMNGIIQRNLIRWLLEE
jgi:hypothetical protein